jgi:hypothetical protein
VNVKDCDWRIWFLHFVANHSPVGASLLAMVVNDDAPFLIKRGVFEPIASKLAPTKGGMRAANERNCSRLARRDR